MKSWVLVNDNKGGWKQGKEVGRAGVVGRDGGKCRKLYLNNNKIKRTAGIKKRNLLKNIKKALSCCLRNPQQQLGQQRGRRWGMICS